MRVLTFGWEFPPIKNGGLGVACFGLTRELAEKGIEVIFVLPKSQDVVGTPRFVFADTERLVKVIPVESSIKPYAASDSVVEFYRTTINGKKQIYSRTILEEVHRFAHKASLIAREENFDIIHAHDWTSYLAGVAAKIVSGKPLILHVHATSFDQAASNNVDPEMYKIEKEAFEIADRIVTVSQFTKNILIRHHGVNPNKIEVVHNGCEMGEPKRYEPTLAELKRQGKKIVLYHGRISIQKGVDHLVWAARKVVDHDPNVVFVISGWGDMQSQILEQVGALGLSNNFIFAGALWDEERDRMYQSADLAVMPSVSEPFGLVPLEAVRHGTPAVISKQSGVAEVTAHMLKVDFWDVDEMTNKILAALRYPVLRQQLVNEGKSELKNITWGHAANKVRNVYQSLLQYWNQASNPT
jgi:glycogen synthase